MQTTAMRDFFKVPPADDPRANPPPRDWTRKRQKCKGWSSPKQRGKDKIEVCSSVRSPINLKNLAQPRIGLECQTADNSNRPTSKVLGLRLLGSDKLCLLQMIGDEDGMFTQPQRSNRNWVRSHLVSSTIHCLVLYLMVRPAPAIFVTPISIAFGNRGTSTQLVHLPRPGATDSLLASEDTAPERIWFSPPVKVKRQRARNDSPAKKKPAANPPEEAARAGSPFGSVLQGSLTGHEVRPALPVVFPDPMIPRSEIPPGVEGSVIVEVTIDDHGSVVETKVVQPLGYGIEEKVLAAVRNWRFRPATIDGKAIPSQQDVYFHFPS
jgi:protein TonB